MSAIEALLSDAMSAMQEQRYDSAISLFDAYLEKRPDDLNGLLHLGICHLLNCSEKMFLKVYDKAAELKAQLEAIPENVARVFAHYEGLVRKVTATALVVGTVAVSAAGCNSSHKYSGGVDLEVDAGDGMGTATQVEDAGTVAVSSDTFVNNTDPDLIPTDADSQGSSVDDTANSAHKYSGGVFLDAGTDSDAAVSTDTAVPTDTVSAHRYSGGVMIDTDKV